MRLSNWLSRLRFRFKLFPTLQSFLCWPYKVEGCVDANECEQGTHRCSSPARVKICWMLDEKFCKNIFYPKLAFCVNDVASYHCSCPLGLKLHNENNCIDIDECNNEKSCQVQNSKCVNFERGFRCECASGFSGDGNYECLGRGWSFFGSSKWNILKIISQRYRRMYTHESVLEAWD